MVNPFFIFTKPVMCQNVISRYQKSYVQVTNSDDKQVPKSLAILSNSSNSPRISSSCRSRSLLVKASAELSLALPIPTAASSSSLDCTRWLACDVDTLVGEATWPILLGDAPSVSACTSLSHWLRFDMAPLSSTGAASGV